MSFFRRITSLILHPFVNSVFASLRCGRIADGLPPMERVGSIVLLSPTGAAYVLHHDGTKWYTQESVMSSDSATTSYTVEYTWLDENKLRRLLSYHVHGYWIALPTTETLRSLYDE